MFCHHFLLEETIQAEDYQEGSVSYIDYISNTEFLVFNIDINEIWWIKKHIQSGLHMDRDFAKKEYSSIYKQFMNYKYQR